ncbi:HAMP domain-containing histidine kinase [Frankia sp. AgB1.9]|uniref:sensor histidine kinase n=1 Tax=unclassified Frankia TaxID=2632575 RepID=UPI001931FCD4|nr:MULTISPECIES: HAMP domain-containing sensor histidine kinase [unclassified Frankia]MBL7491500.1 HAMP domain-containing histidine kinase [Frankia sp. AgW1.1]MBL7550094.1 HAMP domain-containing histidine kinase [Frankia sp. AgB1.9]
MPDLGRRSRRPRQARSRRGRGRGLGSRTALVTTAVALLAVIITGAIFLGQLGRVGEAQARRALGRQADLVADLARRPGALTGQARDPQLRADVVRAVGAQQISLLVLDPDGLATLAVGPGDGRRVPMLAAGTRARLAGTSENTGVRTVAGRRVLVSTRQLSGGNTLVLVQDVAAARELTVTESRRLLIALVVALAVATVAGLVLARRLARPLRALAGAAHALASGRRDVDVTLALPTRGPVEIADVADALAGLAAALATSEARQREFLLSVSHELRTPLTAIRGFAEALADGVTPGPEAPRAGQVILDEALRLDRLVQDLLDLARLDADDFRVDLAPVDLGRVLADAAEVWRSRCAAEGIPLRVEAPPPGRPVVVVGDAARLRQILDGLAENALRVVPAGAPIVLAARAEPSPLGLVGVLEVGVLEVRDGGPGLTADDCAVAFDRAALYERYRGLRPVSTGLGLALVGRLAARLGGSARAGAAAEGGAAFSVRLPLAPLGDAGGSDGPAARRATGPHRVLAVGPSRDTRP